MTAWDVLRACSRRWYVVCLGLLLTIGIAYYIVEKPGVFWARTDVVLLSPPIPARPNTLENTSAGLVATAGLIEREINAGNEGLYANGADVTIVDMGIYHGHSVRLPNFGGQWANNFAQPVLIVQASGPSGTEVDGRMKSSIAEIQQILDRRQDEARVRTSQRITLMPSPANTQVLYSRGNRRRAVAVGGSLGLLLSLTAAVLVDRRSTPPDVAGASRTGVPT